ncbi:hypothetical protein ACHAXA_000566 [Cyclostephanos tholiformis]|uniref:Uncharacterized protein n=1 Tax=Cyclostephanos tholiformis TaxID=382380 RepID=A0ABD3STA7_9STRA
MPATSTRNVHHKNCRGVDRVKFCLQSTTLEKIANPKCDLSLYLLLSERSAMCKSVGRLNCSACALALEPVELRREKVIMLAEAYTIFGALFLAGTWLLYEWGKPRAIEGGEVFYRVFSAVISVVICCNLFLALWSCILWITAVIYGTREDFVFNARHLMQFCNHLMWMTYNSVIVGCGLALYLNLSPNWTDLIVISTFVGIVILRGTMLMCDLQLKVSPLATYHQPVWLKVLTNPGFVFSAKRREELKEKAVAEADFLKSKAHFRHQKKDTDPRPETSMGALLRTAAGNLERPDYDVAKFETNLEEDWFNEPDQLRNRSVECLAKYMPLRLAEEVHKLIGDVEVGVSLREIS